MDFSQLSGRIVQGMPKQLNKMGMDKINLAAVKQIGLVIIIEDQAATIFTIVNVYIQRLNLAIIKMPPGASFVRPASWSNLAF